MKAISMVVATFLVAAAEPAMANPVRLQLKVGNSSITEGASVPVTVVFLDRDFRPVPNDRDRTIQFEPSSTQGGREGRLEIEPMRLRVSSGKSEVTHHFQAKSAGTVLVRVTTDGLAPGEAVLRIVPKVGVLERWVEIQVHAQDGERQLLPAAHEPIPLNHKSMAQFTIIPSVRTPVSFQIETEPAVGIRYGERETLGAAVIHIEKGHDQSDPIYILPPSQASHVRVRAQARPNGDSETVDLEFVPPKPVSIGFDQPRYTPKSDHRFVALKMHLRDKDLIPVDILAEPHDIMLKSDAGSWWTFEPPVVTLSAAAVTGISQLQLPWFTFGRDLQVVAGSGGLSGGVDVQVIATEWALVILALLAGFLGGLARHVYVVRTTRILPRRINGRLDPGLLVNALFSALSGVVLFKAIDLGIVHPFDIIHDTAALGFVIGVTGGFAGILVFESLVERLIASKARVEVAG